jgi:hypothetical protein
MVGQSVLWCLLGLNLCLPSSEWASWAQAIFSAAAVFAAIAVVWWQLGVSKRTNTEAARLVACGVLTHIDQVTGGMQVVAHALKERIAGENHPGNTPRHLVTILGTLPLLSTDDLLRLNAGLPSCAIRLIRACNSVRQIRGALEVMDQKGIAGADDVLLAELYKPLEELASDAAKHFGEAKRELDGFCP